MTVNLSTITPVLTAVLATGKEVEAVTDVIDAMPILGPVLSGQQTTVQLIDSLPALHASGKFHQLGLDLFSLWNILDIALGQPHAPDVVKAIKSAIGEA